MAVTKQISIREQSHIGNTLDYVLDENKTEYNLTTGLNCIPETAKIEFEVVKNQYSKKGGLQGHHVIQSFVPGEVTPYEAHKIGVDLAEQIAPGYQAIVSTHIDKNHIHNHIIINSVNFETGYKYNTCKKQYNHIRSESDRLCKEHNLSIVKSKENAKGIDQATYHIAERGESWKVKLAKTIDEAVESCNSKDQFISYMENMGYEVKWQNENISIKDPEHERFIRIKRLGENYTKEMIENRLGRTERETIDTTREVPTSVNKSNERTSKSNVIHFESARANIKRNTGYENERERYEKYFNDKISISKVSALERAFDNNKKDDTLEQELKLAALLMKIIMRNVKQKKRKLVNKKTKAVYKFDMKKLGGGKMNDLYSGNIEYKEFKKIEGNEKYFNVSNEQFEKLLKANSIHFGALKNDNNTYDLVVKEKDYSKAIKILHNDKINNEFGSISYSEFKKMNRLTKYIEINHDEFNKLKDTEIKFAAFKKGEKMNIAFAVEDMENVFKVIERNFEKQLGNVSYNKMKDSPGKTRYLIVSKNEIEHLRNSGIKFAAFKNETHENKFNIAFKENDIEKVYRAINNRNVKKELDR